MDATNAAPTITIDGVTSRPGTPTTLVRLDCDGSMFIPGHDIEVGSLVVCDDGPHEGKDSVLCTVTDRFQTWVF